MESFSVLQSSILNNTKYYSPFSTLYRYNQHKSCNKKSACANFHQMHNQFNTLRTGDANLRLYITTVQDG
jgi:hypothetical protein